MSISKHVLVMACVLMPSFVVSAMPSARPVVQGVASAAVVQEIKGALNSNLPARVLQVLQDHGLSVNAQLTDKRETALHLAAKRGKMQVAETLLGHEARVNVRDDEGKSSLAYAQASKHTQLAELLQVQLEKELALLEKEKNSEAQDLFEAAKNNDRASVEILLAKGADPKARIEHAKSAYGQLDFKNPFHVAFDAEHYSLAAILLKEAQGINGLDEQGWTPLMIAIMACDWDLVQEFLAEGADVGAGHKRNALDVAEIMENEEKSLKALVAVKGIETDIGDTPLLMWAVSRRIMPAVRYLVEKGADINAKNSYGNTALIVAADKKEGIDMVRYLVEQGADINAKNKDGSTALIVAARWGQIDRVKYLVEQGADIDEQDKFGRTALMLAVFYEHTNIVRYLVEQEAKINTRNKIGKVPLDFAKTQEIKDILRTAQEQQALKPAA